jgi:hypothetical protein
MNVNRTNKEFMVSKYLLITATNAKKTGYFYYAIGDKMKINKEISPQEILNNMTPSDDATAGIQKPGYTLVKVPFHEEERFVKDQGKNTGKSGKYISRKKSFRTQQTETGGEASFAPLSCSEGGGTAVTIDWYYQIYVNGILVSEQYLYSTTECWGTTNTGGGGESAEDACRQAASTFIYSGAATNELMASSTVYQKNNSRVDGYQWKIFTASTWGIVSWDQITWTRPSSDLAWTFSSFTHLKDAEVGISTGGSRTYKIVDATATGDIAGAKVRIDFTVSHQPICTGSNFGIEPVTLLYNSSIVVRPKGVVSPNI